MRRLLIASCVAEAATGVALLVLPGLVCRLILGAPGDATTHWVARLAGLALVALALACWPAEDARGPALGMLAYNAFATMLLLTLGVMQQAGPLQWPAAIVHLVLALLLAAGLARRA